MRQSARESGGVELVSTHPETGSSSIKNTVMDGFWCSVTLGTVPLYPMHQSGGVEPVSAHPGRVRTVVSLVLDRDCLAV